MDASETRPRAERFFRATAVAGYLYLRDLQDWDKWNPARLQFRDEAEANWLTWIFRGDRRIVLTVAELDAALEESTSPQGIHLYVSECLIDEAKRRWLEMKYKDR